MKGLHILLIVFSFVIFFFTSDFVSADGMILKPDPYSDRWDYVDETYQRAYINYQGGIQKMILGVGMEEADAGVVWIFPVPSVPEKVSIDVFTEFPAVKGESISRLAQKNLADSLSILQNTQPYLAFLSFLTAGMHKSDDYDPGLAKDGVSGTPIDVTVHERLEKEGLTTEIITARTGQTLYDFLLSEGLTVEEGSVPVLDHYIGEDYTFVVSRISPLSFEEMEREQPEHGVVFVKFPADRIYYPLLPTSVYGDEVVPATVVVFGHVSPEIFKDIEEFSEVEYFIQKELELRQELDVFYSNSTENVKYTKIEIDAPSNLLTEDLWISPKAPIKTYYTSFFARYPLFVAVILLVSVSMITGMGVGGLLFKGLRDRKGLSKLALVGLSNCLTIFGVVITTILLETKKKNKEQDVIARVVKERGYDKIRNDNLLLAVLLLFIFPFAVLYTIAHSEQIVAYLGHSLYALISLVIVVSVLFFIAFVALLQTRNRPREEDRYLFEDISSWSFAPKDKMKWLFVPLFSLVFFGLASFIVRIIELTV